MNSNVIHYTGTESTLEYSALIINVDFCKQIGIDYDTIEFTPYINDPTAFSTLLKIREIELNQDTEFKLTKQCALIANFLAYIGDNYSDKRASAVNIKNLERVKKTITYIKQHYKEKITLNDISKSIYVDKYWLSREFKKATCHTIVGYINKYRCQKALAEIREGATISEAAVNCGFYNFSFFSKTFKRYIGMSPSEYKNAIKMQS